ncbi:hypothetical protein ANO11243_032020 [Dothideomycetidae sp. 11243]|nr:hypothetical protein ANO11243_032020 [fungal sp. No.11243]
MGAYTNSTQVQASVLHGAKDLRLETRPLSPPTADEVQVAVHSTGLCGSDLHYYAHYRNGDIIVREPLTLGHESAGIVVSVPPGSTSQLKPGDHVALEVGVPCSSCGHCASGRYNICPSLRFRSSAKSFPHFQGTLQQRINHPAKWCHKLPEDMSLAEGALLEPLSVALHAVRRSNMAKGAKVLVLGAGAVGALCAGVAKMQGASTVVIADIDAARTKFAVDHHFADAAFTVPMRRGADTDENLAIARDTAAEIGNVSLPNGKPLGPVDIVFECTGVQACVQAGIYATIPGGRVLLVGMGNPIQTLALSAAALREVDLVGVFRYADTYPDAIGLVSRRAPGDPAFASLVTHTVRGLDKVEQAFETASKPSDAQGRLVMKVVLETVEA